ECATGQRRCQRRLLGDDREDFAMTRVHERLELLIVGLPLGVAHDQWRALLERGEAGNGQLQNERIERPRDVGQEAELHVHACGGRNSLLNGQALLDDCDRLARLPELQLKDISYDNHRDDSRVSFTAGATTDAIET